MVGRFAPSPTGPLHLGNLRTALVSYLHACGQDGIWKVRMEDLDRMTSSRVHEAAQLDELASLGMTPDGPVVRQSERFDLHREAIGRLLDLGRVFECFCTRREIRDAAQAPHGAPTPYPGTCRDITRAQRAEWRRAGRRPALRLRATGEHLVVEDLVAGHVSGPVDDVVLQRNDGVPAYNLAVVVDDAAQGVTHVVRGDDLLTSTPAQMLIQQLLALPTPIYAHIPLVVAPDGTRLAKRHGAVTLADLARRGVGPDVVLARLGASLGLCAPTDRVDVVSLAERFDIGAISRHQWRLGPDEL